MIERDVGEARAVGEGAIDLSQARAHCQTEMPVAEWHRASTFIEVSGAQLLEITKERLSRLSDPYSAVFDVDETIKDSRPRRYAAMIAALDALERESPAMHDTVRVLRSLPASDLGYSVKDWFSQARLLEVGGLVEAVLKAWLPRFLSNEYLALDEARPGALSFIKGVMGLKGQVVYATGRDVPNMGEGTRAALIAKGFPLDDATHLILKQDPRAPDLEFKVALPQLVSERGLPPVAFFAENEPLYFAQMAQLFPNAIGVFVDTENSGKKAVPVIRDNIYRITSWE
jgi:hypothetical protein